MTVIVRVFRRHPGWYTAALVLVLLVALAVVWLSSRVAAGSAPVEATARTGTLDRTVVVTGTIQPSQRADLNFPTGGEVVSVTATVGQQVVAGQPLAEVDAASLSGQVAQARSALAAAEARLAADRDADASGAQLEADRAAVDSAQAQLDVAVQNEAGATLTAPFPGTVAAVNVTVGEQVPGGGISTGVPSGRPGSSGQDESSGAGAGPAAALAATGGSSSSATSAEAAVVVVSTGSYIVEATVDDTQVGELRPGQQAGITPSGAVTPIPGTVESVALVATSTSGVASYPVTITVTGSPPNLHIGSGAQVEIVTERISNAVLVPSSAVSGSGAEASVQLVGADGPVTRPVTVGVTSAGRTQILSGLVSGDRVLLPDAGPAPPPPGGLFGGDGGGQQGGGGPGGPQEEPSSTAEPGGGS